MSRAVQPTVLRQWSSFNNPNTDPWYVVFDSTISEDVTLGATVTRKPIAAGSPVADHMYDEPDAIVISAAVSDVLPWDALEDMRNGLPVNDMYWSPDTRRTVAALERLITVMRAHEPFDVQTGLRLFPNMVCEKIHYVTNQEDAGVLAFEAHLVSVKIVATQVVLYTPRKDKKTKRAADATTTKGSVASSEPTDGETAQLKESLLHMAGGLF